MNLRRTASRGLLAVALLCLSFATAFAAQSTSVPASDPAIRYIGRFGFEDAKAPWSFWSAATIKLRFQGTGLSALLKTSGSDRVQVVVDGAPTQVLALTKEMTAYPVADNLKPGKHTVELVKTTECFVGQISFGGVELPAGTKLLPVKAAKRRVEFIGDSITCGYGVDAPNEKVHFSPDTENAWATYGAVTARALGAEYACEAWSGIWLLENNHGECMPQLWERLNPSDKGSVADFHRWVPQAVVINLGTNDSNKPEITQAEWTAAYRAFIAKIRARYPEAHIFLTLGAMGARHFEEITRYNFELAAAMNAEGDKRIHAVRLPIQDPAKDGLGGDWHPNRKTHQKMADAILPAIRAALNWKD